MLETFADNATEDIFNGVNSTAAKKRLPRDLWRVAFRKLDQLDSATQLEDMRATPGNRLEALIGDRLDQHSIKINDQYRICFEWSRSGARIVEIVDHH